ncbi:MAG: hypothetical protein KDN22_15825 [Verrucomicrobiae bacterium]|nr:hypothetical protein [Verrucomicrobiae bacterium]
MKLKHFFPLIMIACAFALINEAHVEAAEVDGPKRPFVCADFAKGEVNVVGADGVIKQTFKAQNPNDVWALPDGGGVLFAWRRGVKLYDKDGKLAFEWTSPDEKDEIHTCQPLADGNILIAQNGPSRLIEVNRDGKIVKEVAVKSTRDDLHMRFRMCRKLPGGNYLCMISCDNEIREIDPEGKTVRTIKDLPGVEMAKPHAVIRLANGNTLFSTGAGCMAVEVDKNDNIVWKLDRTDLPGIEMGFMTGLTRLPNGNTVICFYQGSHHVIEVTPQKELVWKWRLPTQESLVSIQLLDQDGDASKGEIFK